MHSRAALCLTFLAFLGGARGSNFPNRHVVNPCSLHGHDDGGCTLRSVHGTDDDRMFLMTTGELACEVTLKGCKKGICYSFQDVSSLIQRDPLPLPTHAGLFQSIEVLSGASKEAFSTTGFAFEATDETVVLRYSTYTCQEFYSYRGRVSNQQCSKPQPGITEVLAYAPTEIQCASA